MTTPFAVAEIYRKTQSLRQTAEHFGKSSTWVRLRLAEANEPVNPPTPSKFDTEVAQKLREEGIAFEAIARQLSTDEGLSDSSVRKRLLKEQRRS